MSFIYSTVIFNILVLVIALCVGIITYFKWSYSYWKRRNLPSLKPRSWYGTMENPFCKTKPVAIWLKDNYDEFRKKGLRDGGIYHFATPVYFPVHPDCVKNVLQDDFEYFEDKGFYTNEKADPLSVNLFTIHGKKWRTLRAKLTPTFTSGKIKMMFETLVECSNPLKSTVEELIAKNEKIDIHDIVARYAIDVIGSCAYGLDCNSFKSPNAEFRRCSKKLLELSTFGSLLQLLCYMSPSIGHLFNLRAIPKSVTDFFLNVIQDTVNYRKTNNVKRNDMLQVLLEMKDSSSDGNPEGSSLTIMEIASQCLLFFEAGFETTSITLKFCMYELAKHSDIQQKVREEINAVLSKHNDKITYDSMSELKYMAQVLEETLRMHPPVPYYMRKCIKDYPVPNKNVVIEKGMLVFVPVFGLHYDQEYYPDPEMFDPERFSNENKKKRHPFTHIPFAEGPRICIAMRFGMMEMKVCLTALLRNFIFSVNENTPKILKYNLEKYLLQSNATLWLDAKAIH